MDKQKQWTPDYDFYTLSMFQNTDEELITLGLTPNDIIRFREYEKAHSFPAETDENNDHASPVD